MILIRPASLQGISLVTLNPEGIPCSVLLQTQHFGSARPFLLWCCHRKEVATVFIDLARYDVWSFGPHRLLPGLKLFVTAISFVVGQERAPGTVASAIRDGAAKMLEILGVHDLSNFNKIGHVCTIPSSTA